MIWRVAVVIIEIIICLIILKSGWLVNLLMNVEVPFISTAVEIINNSGDINNLIVSQTGVRSFSLEIFKAFIYVLIFSERFHLKLCIAIQKLCCM